MPEPGSKEEYRESQAELMQAKTELIRAQTELAKAKIEKIRLENLERGGGGSGSTLADLEEEDEGCLCPTKATRG
jgi:hypothetical protein